MNARIPSPNPPAATRTTTVFTSGNSQAVRLPKEFRFSQKTVEISRRGDEIVLRERRRTVGEALAGLRPLTAEEARELDRCMQAARETRPPEEREWFNVEGMASRTAATRPAKRKSTSSKAAAKVRK